MAESLHDVRFPGESAEYRDARNGLLKAEMALREQVEAVAALRRKLPPGGPVAEDYEFTAVADSSPVRLSQLFAPGHESLFVYSFMFGPDDAAACPSCTSFLDGLDGQAPHITQRVSLAVVAKSPAARIRDFAAARGWRHLRLLSSADNGYNATYAAETPDGSQMPMCTVFRKTGGEIRHFWSSEMLFAPSPAHPRHVDPLWPLWNLFDLTPDGRGSDWGPSLSYD